MVAFSDSSRGQTAADTFSSAATGGATNPGGFGNNGGGGDNNDPYQGFVQASQPRGLSAIERAVQNTVQRTKDFLSKPTNRRGILGSLIGGALFGPFGAILGGSLGQRYGGAAKNKFTDFFTGGPSPYGDTIPFTNPRFEKQFTMPVNKPNVPILTDGGITNIDIPNFDPGMNLYADASLKDQNREILENLLNPDLKIDEILDKEQFKQDRQQELLNQILTG